jgi:L,D-peptidoglycan transpeptidase YkuD (ErfK/YbiS/YcfS/YnhG family)
VARPNYGPTEGCIAIAMADWHDLLPLLAPGDTVTIRV